MELKFDRPGFDEQKKLKNQKLIAKNFAGHLS